MTSRSNCAQMQTAFSGLPSVYDQKKQLWWAWHKANPAIWDYFERYSLEAVSSGRKRISHWLIVNRIRWDVAIKTTGPDFKISNDHIAFYARLWMSKHPEHKGLFKIKRMIGEPDNDNLVGNQTAVAANDSEPKKQKVMDWI